MNSSGFHLFLPSGFFFIFPSYFIKIFIFLVAVLRTIVLMDFVELYEKYEKSLVTTLVEKESWIKQSASLIIFHICIAYDFRLSSFLFDNSKNAHFCDYQLLFIMHFNISSVIVFGDFFIKVDLKGCNVLKYIYIHIFVCYYV